MNRNLSSQTDERRWILPIAGGIGVLGGVVLASALARVLGISRIPDVLVPTASPLILAVAAILACYLPVRRAARRVHLIDALRAD